MPAKKSTFKTIHLNPTYLAMTRIDQLCDLLFTGKKIMQMFCSDPGFGKTEKVLRSMKKHGIEPHYSSPTNPSAFCNDLWKHQNSPIFLDDVDHLARSEPCANTAKMAFGSLQRRVVVPVTNIITRNEEYRIMGDPKNEDQPHPRYRPNIPPPDFPLGPKSCLIWNTNKNFSDPDVIAKDMQADFAALVSKGLDPLWIPNDPQDVFDYTLHLVVAEGMLRGHPIGSDGSKGGFSAATVNEVLAFFCEHGARLKEISPRAIYRLALARRVDPNYLAAWLATLLPKPKWQLDIPATPHIEPRKVSATPTAIVHDDHDDDQYEAMVDDGAAEWYRTWLLADQIEIHKTEAPPPKGKRGGARVGAGRKKSEAHHEVNQDATHRATQGVNDAADWFRTWLLPDQAEPEKPPPPSKRAKPGAGRKKSEAHQEVNRDAIIQSIASTLHGRFQIALVTGSPEGIRVQAHDEAKHLFCRATLRPHPEIEDEFSLRILARHEGRFLIEVGEPNLAGDQAKIKDDLIWEVVQWPDAKSALVADCKIAKANGIKQPYVSVSDGRITLGGDPVEDNPWQFVLRDLEWVLRKDVVEMKYTRRGVIAVQVRTTFGEYEFLLRGWGG